MHSSTLGIEMAEDKLAGPLWQTEISTSSTEVRELQVLMQRRASLREMYQKEANGLARDITAPPVQESMGEMLGVLEGQIAKIERQIHKHLQQHPRLLTSRLASGTK